MERNYMILNARKGARTLTASRPADFKCGGTQSCKENQSLTGDFRACEGATIPERGTFRGTLRLALFAAALLLSGCGQIPCEVAPGFPFCRGEVRQVVGKPPIKWNREATCTRKGNTLLCVK